MASQGRAAGLNITQLMQKVERDLGDVQKLFLLGLAEDIVESSPVDSGAYVNAHSIDAGVGSSGGRFTGSFQSGTPSPNPEGERAQAMSKLRSQIEALPESFGTISINNNVPHAYKVEYGGWATRGPYAVYSTALNRASVHLQDAINAVKARQ
jgi:hypothetical protein